MYRAATLALAILTLTAAQAPAERALPPAWEAFAFAWTAIPGYSARVTTFEQKGTLTQNTAFDYTFRKPSSATMHVVQGPNTGVTLVWNGGTTLVAHRGSGLVGLFKKTFPLHDPLVTTVRGSSIDELSFGAILTHGADTAGVVAEVPGPIINGAETDQLTLIPTNSVIDTGLTLEVLDLSKTTHLPVRLLGYEGSTLVRTIDFSNVVLFAG